MPNLEQLSPENISVLVARIPLVGNEGEELKYARLKPHDQLAVSVSRIIIETLMGMRGRIIQWGTFSKSTLALQLALGGYHYGTNFGDAPENIEAIQFKDWHQFGLDHSVGELPQPALRVVKLGPVVGDEREVKVLSPQWQLTGLEQDPDGGWDNWQLTALAYSLGNGKLGLQRGWDLNIGLTETVECGDYNLLLPTI